MKTFVIKIWVFSLLSGLLIVVFLFSAFNIKAIVELLQVFLPFSLAFSSPILLIAMYLSKVLLIKYDEQIVKFFVISLSIIMANTLFYIIGGTWMPTIALAYTTAILLSGIGIIRLESNKR